MIETHLPAFLNKAKGPLQKGQVEHGLKPFLHEFRDGKLDGRNFNNLYTYLDNKTKVWLKSPEGLKAFKPAMEEFFKGFNEDFRKKTDTICDEYHIPKGGLNFDFTFTEGLFSLEVVNIIQAIFRVPT